ncbi:MAG: hypothetical protein IKA73_03950 [Alphaproteobacteria bacterium]|nr:hypothetical protein [Alphaproteobacteria bacterium]MBR2483084.1 hypothetical protein [Alphaproteobacteria bacterium]
MKIKNIAFSGVMGAILATAANAAPTIASKAYVDGLVGENVTNLTQTIEENYNELSEDIGLNAAAIEDNATAIQDMDAAYKLADEATLSSANAYTDQEIDALEQTLANTGTNVGALAERVSKNETNITNLTQTVADNKAAAEQAVADLTNGAVATNTTNIANNASALEALTQVVGQNKTAAENAVKALADGAVATNTAAIETLNGSGEGSVAKKIADAISTYATIEYVDTQDSALDTRVKANEEYIAQHKTDYSTLTQTVAANKAAAEQAVADLTNGAVKANTDAIAVLNGDGEGSVAKAEADAKAYAIPKPDLNQCNAASGLCVLSYNSQGVLQWVDVTEESTTTPDESDDGGQEA